MIIYGHFPFSSDARGGIRRAIYMVSFRRQIFQSLIWGMEKCTFARVISGVEMPWWGEAKLGTWVYLYPCTAYGWHEDRTKLGRIICLSSPAGVFSINFTSEWYTHDQRRLGKSRSWLCQANISTASNKNTKIRIRKGRSLVSRQESNTWRQSSTSNKFSKTSSELTGRY